MRIRALVIASVMTLATFVPVGPASAAAGPQSIVGSFRGAGSLVYDGNCAVILNPNGGHYHSTHLGRGSYSLNLCVTSTAPHLHVTGAFELVTLGDGHVHATVDTDLDNGLTGVPATINGGTKRFTNATGTLTIDVAMFDQTNCDPRIGICLNWKERGNFTGTIQR
jgi:hypothetical protein